jgi:hypothetical protein
MKRRRAQVEEPLFAGYDHPPATLTPHERKVWKRYAAQLGQELKPRYFVAFRGLVEMVAAHEEAQRIGKYPREWYFARLLNSLLKKFGLPRALHSQ